MVMLLSPDRCARRGTERKLVSVRFRHSRTRPEGTHLVSSIRMGNRTCRKPHSHGKQKPGNTRSAALHEKPESTRPAALHEKSGSTRPAALHEKPGSTRTAALHEKPGSTRPAALHRKPQEHTPGKIRMHRDPPAHLHHDPALWADIVIEISCFLMV